MSPMNKADKGIVSKQRFTRVLAKKTRLDHQTVETVCNAFLDQIIEELRAGNKLEFRGTMILGTKVQPAYEAKNPRTGIKMMVPKRRLVYFRKGNRMKSLELELKGRQLTLVECGMG